MYTYTGAVGGSFRQQSLAPLQLELIALDDANGGGAVHNEASRCTKSRGKMPHQRLQITDGDVRAATETNSWEKSS